MMMYWYVMQLFQNVENRNAGFLILKFYDGNSRNKNRKFYSFEHEILRLNAQNIGIKAIWR